MGGVPSYGHVVAGDRRLRRAVEFGSEVGDGELQNVRRHRKGVAHAFGLEGAADRQRPDPVRSGTDGDGGFSERSGVGGEPVDPFGSRVADRNYKFLIVGFLAANLFKVALGLSDFLSSLAISSLLAMSELSRAL